MDRHKSFPSKLSEDGWALRDEGQVTGGHAKDTATPARDLNHTIYIGHLGSHHNNLTHTTVTSGHIETRQKSRGERAGISTTINIHRGEGIDLWSYLVMRRNV
ncbi:hypothetical protein Pcinc_027254 [Petrolisthes cinctipes]|uniref:Uncharacterized protein n=1 Tax=Petrolisthes cinctipes TaxID=88211 RepID=A0AAE1KB34_PETCI|nr:hypothetical protein Pcinc_027254 [Petrolisthes cinctipes]